MDFVTIRQAAKRGPVRETRLRCWVKEGRVPGFYAGSRYYVNYEAFIEQLRADVYGANTTTSSDKR